MKSFNCLADQELREGIKEYSEWPTIPQVYVKGEFVGGCDIILSSKSGSRAQSFCTAFQLTRTSFASFQCISLVSSRSC